MTIYYMRGRYDLAHLPSGESHRDDAKPGARPGATACGELLFSDAVEVDELQVLVFFSDSVCPQCDPGHKASRAQVDRKSNRLPLTPPEPARSVGPAYTPARNRVLRWAS